MTHPIIQAEVDAFREQYVRNDKFKEGMIITPSMLESFLLASLQRCSQAVVEESVG